MIDLIFVEELKGFWAFKEKEEFTVEILQSTPHIIHYIWFTDSRGLSSLGSLPRKEFLILFDKIPED